VGAVIQGIEAVAVFGASVLAGVDAVSGHSYHVNSGIALTVIGIGTALALGWVAAGLARARQWSRTPALLTQLFAGIVSIYLLQGHRYAWGGPGMALALAGFAALFVPPSLRALARGPIVPPADAPAAPDPAKSSPASVKASASAKAVPASAKAQPAAAKSAPAPGPGSQARPAQRKAGPAQPKGSSADRER
jgi:hypothetical protein